MKKIYCLLMLVLLCIFPAGCGRKETESVATGYYEILSKKEAFYDVASAEDELKKNFLGMQYYQGEAVQVWAGQWPDEYEAYIYLYNAEGERTRVMAGLPREESLVSGTYGYLDRDGNFYSFGIAGITKRAPSGERLYCNTEFSQEKRISVSDICQLEDGRIFLAYAANGGGWPVLGELDTENGSISNVTAFQYSSSMYMSAGDGGMLCLDDNGIYRRSLETGSLESLWSFLGTTYVLPEDSGDYLDLKMYDFRMGEDGNPEFLWGERRTGAGGFVEKLRKVDAGAGRTPVVVRGKNINKWCKEMAGRFNQGQDAYFVVLEESGYYGDWDDYARQASLEVAAGKGPDIFYGDVLGEYAYGIAQKGGFADLAPFLESSGMDENDYFPLAFEYWRDGAGIYSVAISVSCLNCGGYYIDAAMLGGNREPDVGELVNSLLSWQGQAVYLEGLDSQGVLGMLINGTEDIWGAVDWEAGTCDFGGSLFAEILEAAKRYGDDAGKNYPELLERESYSIFFYKDHAMLEEEGLAAVGTLFDDGCHPLASIDACGILAVNTNSARKEGAWEFIRFLLGDEAQESVYSMSPAYPVSRAAFAATMAEIQEKDKARDSRYRSYPELTDERIQEFTELMETARFTPTKTAPILEIIYDEAQDYFDGIKGIEEVTTLINNRVQLYLDEIR